MFRIRPAAALFAALLSVVAVPAAATNLDFRMVNDTDYTLMELYVSPHSSDQWGRDVLGRNVIDAHGSAMVRFPKPGRECTYDIRMVFDDGDVVTDSANLCEIGTFTVH